MSSTNKTTHYNLSQYVASDKPTYLVDYNADMSAIDTGIYAAKSEANTNTSAIGNLESLNTTAKTNLVSAINEIDGDLGTLSGTVGQHTTDIATNTSAIGNLASLNTTAKNNLVAAINETNEIGTYLSLTRYEDITFKYGLNNAKSMQLKLATNEAGSVFKLYGQPRIEPDITGQDLEFTGQTRLRPDSEYNITGFGLAVPNYANGITRPCNATIKTNGEVIIKYYNDSQQSLSLLIPPCLYFNNDFGDTPSPSKP